MHGLENTDHRLAELERSAEAVLPVSRPVPERGLVAVTSIEAQQRPTQSGQSLRIVFILGCVFSLFPLINSVISPRTNKDYKLWYAVGRSVLAGQPLYEVVPGGEPEYMYPPTVAVLGYAPLSCLGPFLFTLILCLLTAGAWSFSLWAARVMVAGQWTDPRSIWSIAPALAVASYVWDVQLLGQLNLLLLAMTLGAFWLASKGRQVTAGSLLGAAVAIKVFPLPVMAYFVVRRQWRAVVATLASIVVLSWFLPGMFRGFERNTNELQQWARLMIADQSGQTMAGRSSIGFSRRNQSLVSVSHRLLRHIDAGDKPQKPLYVNFADVSPKMAQRIGYGSCLLLGVVLLVACRFRFGQSVEAEGLEVAMVCTLVPLCSTLSWTYYFCWLLPAWVAIGNWLNNPRMPVRVRQNAFYGMIVAGLLLISAVSEQFDATLQAMGVTAWGSVALFMTLAYLRFNLPQPTPQFEELVPIADEIMEPSSYFRRRTPK